ncbi:hypothetical protein HHL11_02015 [Ramlibacter sp. G-1-2-2]|uniref:Uncharacterized protein n=1 Tax=Ramlibacter agri TaxID=2728837 RepID=A0A848GV48_9BURK|nr:hypothetical protein [Ramlibacter agri]NML42506.1 hypothetical protein [Ramlibacter agri]
MLLFTDILTSALLRATFYQGLSWRSPGDGFAIERGTLVDRITDAFRFEDDGAWMEMEASASVPIHEMPHIKLRVSVPASLPEDKGFRAANDVNRRGLASVHFDAPEGALVVQQTLIFSGYHEVNGLEIDSSIVFAQREATLNMLLAVFGTCEACLRQLQPNQVLPSPHVRRVKMPSAEVLEQFTAFVLARMYRWDCVDLPPGSAALELLRQAAIRTFTEETLQVEQDADPCQRPDRQLAAEAARERIDRWLRDRFQQRTPIDPWFDMLLYDVDRKLRWTLRDVMANPPSTREVHQLTLLEQALAVHRPVWEGVRYECKDLRAALALGLDIEVDDVAPRTVDRLLERFPFLAPAADATATVPPQPVWLTR